jgi:hypothetical protein
MRLLMLVAAAVGAAIAAFVGWTAFAIYVVALAVGLLLASRARRGGTDSGA